MSATDPKLDELAKLLKRKALTPRGISAALGYCKPTAYKRLAALRALGYPLYTFEVRESLRGPTSTAYGIR